MDHQAFRRELMLASGLLREAGPAELALMERLRKAQAPESRQPPAPSLAMSHFLRKDAPRPRLAR